MHSNPIDYVVLMIFVWGSLTWIQRVASRSVKWTFSLDFMLKKISLLPIYTYITLFVVKSASAQTASAALPDDPLEGLDQSVKGSGSFQGVEAFKAQAGSNTDYSFFVQSKVGQIVGLALSFVGVIFLILMIYAGVMWMTAQGNDQQVSKAKNLLINATIGLVIVFAAYAITSFIGGEILR